jgi:hypothetical protein
MKDKSPHKIKVEKQIFYNQKDQPFKWKDIKNLELEDDDVLKMHALLNKLCPGSYGARPDLTIAEKFDKLLTEGPEWTVIKKEEKE